MSDKATWQGQTSTPTRIVLLRHGQTPLSVERRYSGRGNPSLTDVGLAQATAAATRLSASPFGSIDTIVSSPLARTRDTAEFASRVLGVDVAVHEGLIETDFGEWEGLTFREAAERDGRLHRKWLSDVDVAPPGGESFAAVADRIAQVRDDLVDQYPGQTILAVSHVTPIKTFLRGALGVGPELLFRMHLDLASFSIVEFYPDGGSVVRLVNDTAHLQ
ncbi:probable phosphoglycerate mutase [Gordonia malaquae]|uniref:Putative acid phosphatase n=1 Tax=Gordonia malaquae NBRC 108250 TaxID=1223542 RepID=M3UTP1_GORML|nr:histidine phosphatase family protein [Gordonia malaquae]GAC78722.1 putative acid phosphatase [Gordonia malaquae NBRC 108250]SED62374.1 probable phosphoglycerate mutase [Gordonia malaquae]